jgi:hypothetical protein
MITSHPESAFGSVIDMDPALTGRVPAVAVLDLHLMKSAPRLILLLLSVGACRMQAIRPPPESVGSAPAAAPAPVSCRPERGQSITVEPARVRRCVIDVGSRNVKLVVASSEGDDPRSIRGERLCRSRLQLGEKTYDQKAHAARPLSPADQEALSKLLGEYAALCQQDGGQLIGAFATEWARRATNGAEIRDHLRASGIRLEVLSREDEARFGYLAATRGAPGKTVLDFGSRSLQISYWPRGAAAPVTASVPLGIDEAGDRFFGKKDFRRYAPARAAFTTAVRSELAPHIVGIRRAIRAGTLGPELFSLAENGDVPLALDGKLFDLRKGPPGVDERTYAERLKERAPSVNAQYGVVTAVLNARELTAFAKQLEGNTALFEELRSDRLKRIYGYKMLAMPALVAALAEDLSLTEVVLVPQEMPEGLLVEKLRATASNR